MDKFSFDYNPSALSDGLIGAGIQMMLGSTNQRMPIGLLGALANGMAGFGQGLQNYQQNKYLQEEMKDKGLMREIQKGNLQLEQDKLAKQKAAQEAYKNIDFKAAAADPYAMAASIAANGGDPSHILQYAMQAQNTRTQHEADQNFRAEQAQLQRDFLKQQAQQAALDRSSLAYGLQGMRANNASSQSYENDLSPDALELAAIRYNQTGALPPMGMGKNATHYRNLILSRAAEMTGGNGSTPQEQVNSQLNNAADYVANKKAIGNFTTGQEGRTVRSLNAAIKHLSQLDEIGNALNNGDTQLINKAANAYKAATGLEAPTSFDALKNIVGQEVVKSIVANGGGQAEREEAGKMINSALSPQQLQGVIKTYHGVMGGQLHALQQQYKAATSREDFNDRFLSPETKTILGVRDQKPSDVQETKIINGKTYYKVNGQWHE